MEEPAQTHRFTWQDIEIEATYWPRKWGGTIAHLEIRSTQPDRAPLPTTETGYRSHFHACGTVEAYGGDVAAQVIAWLDEAAQSPHWKRRAEQAQQLSLF